MRTMKEYRKLRRGLLDLKPDSNIMYAYRPCPEADPDKVQKHYDYWREHVQVAPVFLLNDVQKITSMTDEVMASAKAMHQVGVYKLPFPRCTFLLPTDEDSWSSHLRGMLMAVTATQGKDFIIIDHAVLHEGKWYINPARVAIHLEAENPLKHEVAMLQPDEALNTLLTDEEQVKRVGNIMHCVVQNFIVFMSTTGITVEYINTRTDLKYRDHPEYSYRRLAVGGGGIGTGEARGPQLERKRVRLHIRRGHVRMQACGPGLHRRKEMWIKPVLVGYQEEGAVFKHYEVRA